MEKLQWTKRLNQEKVDEVYLKHFGSRYKEYRKLWNKAGKDFIPDYPIHIDFEVIDVCNLRCLHCLRHKDISGIFGLTINTGRSFPLDVFENIVKNGVKEGLNSVNLGFSGEPMLNPDVLKMIEIAHRSGVLDIRILTNGTMISKDLADKLVTGHLTFLSFSIDAGTDKTYRELKGKDYFEHIRQIVRYAYERRNALKKDMPLIRATFYPCSENNHEEAQFLLEFQDYVDFIDFQTFQDLRRRSGSHYRIKDCLDPFRRLAIYASGEVVPCCTFYSKKLVVGNLSDSGVKEIWNSKKLQDVRKGFMKKSLLTFARNAYRLLFSY